MWRILAQVCKKGRKKDLLCPHSNNSVLCITFQVVVAQNEARILKNYNELIQEGRESFKKEVQSLMPEAKIGKKGEIF